MQGIITTIVNLWRWLRDVVGNVFDSAIAAVEDIAAWFIDNLLGAGVEMIAAMPVDELDQSSVTGALAVLPFEILNVLWVLNVAHALGIVATAYGIRFALQTIPFVRWGS